jgi:cytochrome P450
VLLEYTMKEVLRLHPIIDMLERYTTRQTTIGGYSVPAGTPIYPYIRGAQLVDSERKTKRSMDFIPERWSPDSDLWIDSAMTDKERDITLFAFGMGPMHCIGFKMANLEFKTVLGELVRRFEIRPSPSQGPPIIQTRFTAGLIGYQVVVKPV